MGRRAGPDCSQRRHQAWAETFLPRLRFAAIAMDRRYPLKFSQGDGIKAYFKLKPNVGKTAFMKAKMMKKWATISKFFTIKI